MKVQVKTKFWRILKKDIITVSNQIKKKNYFKLLQVAWKPDGTQLLTSSGDKTCRLWDVETKTVVSEFIMGNQVEDQQVSCLWQGQHLLSVSLSGFITYLDVNDPNKPIRVIKVNFIQFILFFYREDGLNLYLCLLRLIKRTYKN